MILTDVDGVLLDWFAGFKKFVQDKGIEVAEGDPADWSMVGWVKSNNIQGLISEFNDSWAFEYLPHYVTAKSQLKKLHEEGHAVVAITSCSSDSKVREMRINNLERKFGPIFEDVICLPLMESKLNILSQYAPTFWVEDSLHGAKAGVEAGHRTFLLDKPYNQGPIDKRIERVKDWYEIYERIENSRT